MSMDAHTNYHLQHRHVKWLFLKANPQENILTILLLFVTASFDNIVTEETNSATITANNSQQHATSVESLQEYAWTLVAEKDLQ